MRRRGSVVIVSVLVVAFALIGISALLTSSYLSGYQLDKSDFRGTVTQIVSSSRGAVVMALADVSKILDQRVKTYPPSPYYDPDDISLTTAEINEGYTILSAYQNNTRASYPGTGLLINFSDTDFACNWTDTEKRTGYSVGHSNVTIDVPNIGFSGMDNYVDVELNATLRNLIDTDGSTFSFTATILAEGNNPIDNLNKNLVRVYYANYTSGSSCTLTEFTVYSIHYTDGVYLVTCGSEYETIPTNLSNLKTQISAIPDANFTDVAAKTLVLSTIDEIDTKYDSYDGGDRGQPWLSNAWVQTYEVRTKMDHTSPGCIVKAGIDTTDIVSLADLLLSQLKPTIRLVVTDFRGVTVSAYGVCEDEAVMPMVIYEKAVSAGGGAYTLTATADNHLSDNDHITQAVFYVSNSASSIPGGATAHAMSAVDGSFNSAVERLTANVQAGWLYVGSNYLWIKAKDAAGHWSDYVKVKIPGYMHLASIDTVGNVYIIMQGQSSGGGSGTKYWATAQIRVLDDNGNPLSGVTVTATWSGSYSWTGTATTNAAGYCTFETSHKKYTDWPTIGGNKVFTITITSLAKSGYQWTGSSQTDTIKLTASKTWTP